MGRTRPGGPAERDYGSIDALACGVLLHDATTDLATDTTTDSRSLISLPELGTDSADGSKQLIYPPIEQSI